MKKPPLGVTPEYIWRQARMDELTRACRDYLEYAQVTGEPITDTVGKWAEELMRLSIEHAVVRARREDGIA